MGLIDSIVDPVIEALEGAWKAIQSIFTDTPVGSSSMTCPHAISAQKAQQTTGATPYFTTPTGADTMVDEDFSEAHQQLARHRIERDRQKALMNPPELP